MADLSPPPKFKWFVAGTSTPLAGGKLYTYLAGTLTPQATAKDQAGTANTNPIILDANGECDLWLGSFAFKLVLKDSLDVQQWSVDNVTTASYQISLAIEALTVATFSALASTPATVGQVVSVRCHTSGTLGGGSFIAVAGSVTSDTGTQINSATGAIYWKRINLKFVTPEMFGCVSTSTAIEATRAINKAYVYANANSVPVAYEQLAYALDGNIDGTSDSSSLSDRGGIQVKSNTVTIFTGQVFTQIVTTNPRYSLLNFSGASNFEVRGEATFIGDALTHVYVGPPGADEFGYGIYLANAHNGTISGITCKTCWGDGCYISDTLYSTLAEGTATATSNITLNDCIFTQNRRQGCSGINGTGIVFNRCQFINTGTLVATNPASGVDLETDASVTRLGMQDWAFNDCIMSGNVGPNVQLFPTLNNGKAGCEDIQFNNCKMTGTSAQGSYWSDRASTYVKNITINGGVIEGGVYSGNATHFNNVKISKAVTDAGAGSYVIEQNATTHGAKYLGCEIRAIGDTTVNSKKLIFGSTSGIEANKTEFTNCKLVAYSVYGGATNILIATTTPLVFTSCEFLTEGTAPASFVGFDNTAGSSRVSPSYSMLYDCYIDPTWHNSSTSFSGRFNINTSKILSKTYITNNKVPTAMADIFEFVFTGNSAVQIDNPTDAFIKRLTIRVKNTSAGALGVITWDTKYKMAAWTNPATLTSRSIDFIYDGTNWIEASRTPADVPN